MAIEPTSSPAASGAEYPPKTVAATGSPAPAKPAAAPSEAKTTVQQPGAVPNLAELEEAVKSIKAAVEVKSQGLEFVIDDESERPIVRIIDTQTKEVLRQIPSEEALNMAKAIDRAAGLLVRQKA
ncbi:MAG TPA: flagellar protein FlaG [Noviherbaspirillum sp.]|uniref:flagellar protein FlaG n=1 Tax=Noviherbaspirillum sp. TaxID=1926288 RepID=UPI002F944E32